MWWGSGERECTEWAKERKLVNSFPNKIPYKKRVGREGLQPVTPPIVNPTLILPFPFSPLIQPGFRTHPSEPSNIARSTCLARSNVWKFNAAT